MIPYSVLRKLFMEMDDLVFSLNEIYLFPAKQKN